MSAADQGPGQPTGRRWDARSPAALWSACRKARVPSVSDTISPTRGLHIVCARRRPERWDGRCYLLGRYRRLGLGRAPMPDAATPCAMCKLQQSRRKYGLSLSCAHPPWVGSMDVRRREISRTYEWRQISRICLKSSIISRTCPIFRLRAQMHNIFAQTHCTAAHTIAITLRTALAHRTRSA